MAENIWGTDILKSVQQPTPRNPSADDAFIRNMRKNIAREEPVTPGLLSTIGDYYTNVTEYPYGEAFDRFKFLLGPSTEAVAPEAIQKSIETKKVNPRTGKTTAGIMAPSNEDYAEAMRSTAGIMAPTDSGVDSLPNKFAGVVPGVKPRTPMAQKIINSVKFAEGKYQRNPSDKANWTEDDKKGKLVGTNMGVTPESLSKHLDIDRSDITEKMIRDVTKEQADNIFVNQYLRPSGVLDMPEEVQLILGDLAILRPATVRSAVKKGVKTVKEAMDHIINSYAGIPKKQKYYRDHIRGWINRSRRAAGMKELDTFYDLYTTYPKLTDDIDKSAVAEAKRNGWKPPTRKPKIPSIKKAR